MLGPRAAAQRFGGLADDVEAEARAVDRSHTLVRAEEALEQLIAFVGRYADAVVANPDHHPPLSVVRLLPRAGDLDKTLLLCSIGVLDGVGEIILDAKLEDRKSTRLN